MSEPKRVVVEFRDPSRGGFADHNIQIADDGRIRPIFREGREWLFSHTEIPVNPENEPIGPTIYVFSKRRAGWIEVGRSPRCASEPDGLRRRSRSSRRRALRMKSVGD